MFRTNSTCIILQKKIFDVEMNLKAFFVLLYFLFGTIIFGFWDTSVTIGQCEALFKIISFFSLIGWKLGKLGLLEIKK